MDICESTFWTPGGDGTVVTEDGRLVEVRLPAWDARVAASAESAAAGAGAAGYDPGVSLAARSSAGTDSDGAGWAAQLEAYFRGERRDWVPDEVDLEALEVPAFHRDVYRALLHVRAGATVSYGGLAVMAGRPRAARAVGTAMARNPLAIVVPCHRVVRFDGRLGHYGFGDGWKAWLLRFEAAGGWKPVG